MPPPLLALALVAQARAQHFAGRCALDRPKPVAVPCPTQSPALWCTLHRHAPTVGWPGYSRPNGTKHTSDAIFMPASATTGSGQALCHLDRAEFPLITGGNATLAVLTADCPRSGCETIPLSRCCASINSTLELFALFEPQFGRRPYFRETEGSIVLATDRSLANVSLRLHAALPGGVQLDAAVPGGRKWRVPFPLHAMPTEVNELVNISLLIGGAALTKQRRFSRHPPPAADSAITAFQVDHERGGAMRANGVEFVAQGWFNGGYSHQVNGLGAKEWARYFNASEPSYTRRQALNLGAIATHWGARGLNFVRFQGQFLQQSLKTPEQIEDIKVYLDACASAGVFALWDSNIDTIANLGFNGTEDEPWRHLLGNLSVVRDHPAFGGYYACA